MVEVGKELQTVDCRLRDIIFLCERTQPVKDGDWHGYAADVLRIIANQARQARTYLGVVEDGAGGPRFIDGYFAQQYAAGVKPPVRGK